VARRQRSACNHKYSNTVEIKCAFNDVQANWTASDIFKLANTTVFIVTIGEITGMPWLLSKL
jgi:hypothetical protein